MSCLLYVEPCLRKSGLGVLSILVALLLLQGASFAAANYLGNGDFEVVQSGEFAAWQDHGIVAPRQVSGLWQTITVEFNSLDQTQVLFYFEVQIGSIGSVFVDNVRSPQISISNGGFESGRTGWNTSSYGSTTFVDTSPPAGGEGSQSLRITHRLESTPVSSINRTLSVTPNTNYTIMVDVYIWGDFQGEGRALVFDGSTGSNCLVTNYGECLVSGLVQNRDKCGKYVAQLEPGQTAAELYQVFDPASGINLQASLDLMGKGFAGDVTLLVDDPATGNVIRSMDVTVVNDGWRTHQMTFHTGLPQARLRIIAEGTGDVWIDNVSVTTPKIVPPLQDVVWLPSSENYRFTNHQLLLDCAGPSSEAIEGAFDLLAEDLAAHGITCVRTSIDNANLKVLLGPTHAVPDRGPEAYSIKVDSDGITIKAGYQKGGFYGVMTLLQLITEQGGEPVFMACEATDWPDMPMRGVLDVDDTITAPQTHTDMQEQAARWKMNTVTFSCNTNPDNLNAYMAACKSLNLDPIPYIITFYSGILVEQTNPNLACGIKVTNESKTLTSTNIAYLANKYVIRTNMSDIVVKNSSGTITYQRGVDYEVINGDMAWPYDLANPASFGIRRVAGSAIPSGATVKVSYDYVSHYRGGRYDTWIPYCPVEPEARQIISDWLEQFCREFEFPYINTSHCLQEFGPVEGQMATDSRVVNSGKTPVQLMAEDLCMQDAACKAGNPNVRQFQWAGEVNSYCQAVWDDIPDDCLINIWGYDAKWPETYGRDALEFWSEKGFKTSVMPWANLENVRGFARIVKDMRALGYPCIGMVDSCWSSTPDPTGGVQETAIVSWNTPAEPVILFSENFESGNHGQRLIDPPYNWVVPPGWTATNAVVTSWSNFAPSLALDGGEATGDHAYMKGVVIPSGNNDRVVLSAKVWTEPQSLGGTPDAGVGFSLGSEVASRGAYVCVDPDAGGAKQRWRLRSWLGPAAGEVVSAVAGKDALKGTVKIYLDYNRDVVWAEVYDQSNTLQWKSDELPVVDTKVPNGVFLIWDRRGTNSGIDVDDIVLEHIPLVPPAPPINLHITAVNTHSVSLAWNDTTGEQGYKVFRGAISEAGPWSLVAGGTLPANSIAFTDTDAVQADTEYWYKVQAFSSEGSADSNVVQTKAPVAVTTFVTYQGKLINQAGVPVADGNYTFIFGIFDVETGGTAVWTSASTSVAVSQGLFTTKISDLSVSALPADTNLWLELTVNGETMAPRIPVGADFFAIRAGKVAE